MSIFVIILCILIFFIHLFAFCYVDEKLDKFYRKWWCFPTYAAVAITIFGSDFLITQYIVRYYQ